jgi:hypothetical protein
MLERDPHQRSHGVAVLQDRFLKVVVEAADFREVAMRPRPPSLDPHRRTVTLPASMAEHGWQIV